LVRDRLLPPRLLARARSCYRGTSLIDMNTLLVAPPVTHAAQPAPAAGTLVTTALEGDRLAAAHLDAAKTALDEATAPPVAKWSEKARAVCMSTHKKAAASVLHSLSGEVGLIQKIMGYVTQQAPPVAINSFFTVWSGRGRVFHRKPACGRGKDMQGHVAQPDDKLHCKKCYPNRAQAQQAG